MFLYLFEIIIESLLMLAALGALFAAGHWLSDRLRRRRRPPT